MFIQVKSQGNVVSALCREAVVSADRVGKQTSIRIIGQDEPKLYNQTAEDFEQLLKQLTSEL